MMHGEIGPFTATTTLAVNTLHLLTDTVAVNERLVRVVARLDGAGGGAGDQTLRAVIYDAAGTLLAASDAITVAAGTPAAWRPLSFAAGGLEIVQGATRYGLHVGATSNVARLQRTAGGTHLTAADTYADGPASVLPATASAAGRYGLFLETTAGYVVPDATDLELAAVLPFTLTQRIFGAGGVVARSRRSAGLGFHGQAHEDTQGALAIVRTGGPLEDLVGQRLKVTRRSALGDRAVFVYAATEEDWPEDIVDEDLSVPVRAWMELGNLAEDTIAVDVEVMA